MRGRVVITGLGAVSPLGVGARRLFHRWAAGESGLEGGVGRCSEFEPTDVMSTKDVRRSDRFTQLAVAAGAEAVSDAGWDDSIPYDPADVGCVIGTGIGGLGTIESGHDALRDRGSERVPPLLVPLMMTNAAAGVLAMRHGLRGQSYSVGSACAAGSHAIGVATRMIQSGDVVAVLAGGAEAALTPLARAAFAAMDATSQTGISRPFDARRDGFVMGEGAGVLVLEDVDAAAARGAEVLGELLGYLNDRAETVALKSALTDDAARVPVSSLKSAIGHLLGAAGAVEAVATVLALRERLAPPTLGYEQPDEGMDLDYVPGRAKPLRREARVALSNSFGFGGHNSVLCLGAVR